MVLADADTGAPATTRDAFFGGRLILTQPAKGHRSGTDAVLLAAAVPRDFGGLVYDIGAGVGAAGLGLAVLAPHTRVVLLERDREMAHLAERNIAANEMTHRVEVAVCDLLEPEARRRALEQPADLIVTNPPFHDAAHTRPSPSSLRRAAHVLDAGATLGDWLHACLDLLAPKGTLIVVHASPAVPDILAVLRRHGAGAITLKSVHPRQGEPARRVLIRAIKGNRAPFALAAPLVLHANEGFTPEAERLHRGEAALDW